MSVALGTGFVLLSLAVTLLLFERRRRLAAEERLHQLSGRLITAQEEERSRIARDLHDDAGQRLALLAIELDQLGLLPAARRFAADLAARHSVAIDVASDEWPDDVPRQTALVLYRVMQEALQNAVRHSGASRIEVAFRRTKDGMTLRVSDGGRGFVLGPLGGLRGLGLAGMSERLRLVGGGLRIDSRPGGGTIVEAWLPPVQPRAGAPGVPDPFPTS